MALYSQVYGSDMALWWLWVPNWLPTACLPNGPGRRGRLPARTPLRTVLESFPSYGSSLHKASRDGADPRGRNPAWPYRHPAATTLCSFTTALRRTNRQASVVICCLNEQRFEVLSCHFRPDRRGRIRCITPRLWLLRSSQCCSPPDPPCGKACPVARPGGAGSFSMFHNLHDG
jgi:hypothetical protein